MTISVVSKPEISSRRSNILCRRVYSESELKECFKIRRKVFVEEQKLFLKTDRDRYDVSSLHIAAFQGGRIVGTVRVHQQGKGVWFGSRLAVLKGCRGRAGRLLIAKAIETVKKKKAKKFLAYIQLNNVSFFKRCGWSETGERFQYHGAPHQMMEADLKTEGSRGQGFKG